MTRYIYAAKYDNRSTDLPIDCVFKVFSSFDAACDFMNKKGFEPSGDTFYQRMQMKDGNLDCEVVTEDWCPKSEEALYPMNSRMYVEKWKVN